MSDVYIVDVERDDAAASVSRVRQLVTETAAPAVAFMATAVPNGEPLGRRVEDWVRRFLLLKEGLSGTGARVGILVQALIGHGDRRQSVSAVPFQKIVGEDGAECAESFCPLDRGFQSYARSLITGLAVTAPAFFMIDDDFRIAYHDPAHKGCMCALHLERLATVTGVRRTREELLADLRGASSAALLDAWDSLRRDSLVEMAAVIRSSIDGVDPSIPGSLCTVIAEAHFAPAIAAALAGRHAPLIRVNNASYLEQGHKALPLLVSRTRLQSAPCTPDTVILTEADTCPHSRHSLSVKSHLAHVTATTLMGCRGGKYWFVKTDAEGCRDTAPFAAMLGRVRPFLDEVGRIRDSVAWQGPRVTARMAEVFRKPWDSQRPLDAPSDEWGSRVFGRLGIAFTVTPDGAAGSPCAMSGTAPFAYDDQELRALLAGPLLLDGEAAWHLDRRGLSRHLGVCVGEPGFHCTEEIIPALPGSATAETSTGIMGGGCHLLKPCSAQTRVLSRYVCGTLADTPPGSPGLTWHANDLGGRVAVYGLSMKSSLDWTFYNGKRKRQLLETLAWLSDGREVCAAETDLDVLVLHGRDVSARGRQYIALFNLNPDTVEGVALRLPGGRIASMERLGMDGRWKALGFTQEGSLLRCKADAQTMEPFILRIGG